MRHKERHTARGASLLRKDTFMQNLNPIVTAAMANKNGAVAKKTSPTVSLPKFVLAIMLTVRRCSRGRQNARLGCSPLRREQAQVHRERRCRRPASTRQPPTWAAPIR